MNALQDGRLQHPRYGYLGHLEGAIARTRNHLGADLDQFLPEHAPWKGDAGGGGYSRARFRAGVRALKDG